MPRAFGSTIEARSSHPAAGDESRMGLNGQERDVELAAGMYTAEYWEYDARIGRRWNVDPVVYPWQSPYACFNNNPVYYADPNGLEGISQGEANAGKGKNGDTYKDNNGNRFIKTELGWFQDTRGFWDRLWDWAGEMSQKFHALNLKAFELVGKQYDKAVKFWDESKFVAQINTKVDAGLQAKINGGVIKGKLNLVSFELAQGTIDIVKMFDENEYADEDDSVTGSHIFNNDGKGVNVEQGVAVEGYVPIGKNGEAFLGLGGDYKHTFNTNNPNDDHHEKNGYLIIPIEVISKATNKIIFKNIMKVNDKTMHMIENIGGSESDVKTGKNGNFYGIDLSFGASLIVGGQVSFKIGLNHK